MFLKLFFISPGTRVHMRYCHHFSICRNLWQFSLWIFIIHIRFPPCDCISSLVDYSLDLYNTGIQCYCQQSNNEKLLLTISIAKLFFFQTSKSFVVWYPWPLTNTRLKVLLLWNYKAIFWNRVHEKMINLYSEWEPTSEDKKYNICKKKSSILP